MAVSFVGLARAERRRTSKAAIDLDDVFGDPGPWRPAATITNPSAKSMQPVRRLIWPTITLLVATALCAFAIYMLALPNRAAGARDLDGKYADNPLHQWFDGLASHRGLCCSFADGVSIENVDWDTQDGKYRVRLCPYHPGPDLAWPTDCKKKEWVIVPDDAVVTEPNKFGPAVVWPYQGEAMPDDGGGDHDGVTQIRCFLPGAGA
jgi:hypothetical protein